MGQSHRRSPLLDVAPVNGVSVAAKGLAGVGPGNLFGAPFSGVGSLANGVAPAANMANGVAALGPLAALATGGYNMYNGISSIAEDGLGWGNGLQTTGGGAAVLAGAGGLAGMGLFGTGAVASGLAAAGPYGAAAAAGIGLGMRGEGFMQDHFGFGIGDVMDGANSGGRDIAEFFGADRDGLAGDILGGTGTVLGAVGGGAMDVVAGVAGVGEDIGGAVYDAGSWIASGVSSWFD